VDNKDYVVKYTKEIKEALKLFGEYNYYDKGAHESMEIPSEELLEMEPEFIASILVELLKFEHGEPFVEACIFSLDHMDDDWWDRLTANNNLGDFY